MASKQSNDNVLELLQQLEALKQKKARNVKKLKRKLGRAVLLRQDSNIGPIPDNTEQRILRSKPIISEARSVLSELNCKNSSLPVVLSSESEILPRNIGGNCTDYNADINLLLSQSKKVSVSQVNQPLLHQSLSESNEKETALANLDLGVTTSTNYLSEIVLENNLQDQILHKKRSSSEFVNEGQHTNHTFSNKKIKTDVSTKVSQIQTEGLCTTRTDKNSELCPSLSFIKVDYSDQMPEDTNRICQNKEGTCTENDTIGIVQSSQLEVNSTNLCMQTSHLSKESEFKKLELPPDKTSGCQINSSVANKKDTNSLPLKYPEKSIRLDMIRGKFCEVNIAPTEPNEDQLKNIVKDSCILEDKKYTAIANETERNKAALGMGDVLHNFASVNQSLDLCQAEPHELNFEEDLDYTITEVAETVAVFLSKSTPELIDTNSNSLIGTSQLEVANYEEIGIGNSPSDTGNTEDMKNFQQVTGKFDEENSNCSQLHLVDSILQQHNSDSDNTDCEDFNPVCDNSADVYQNECDSDILIRNSQEDAFDVSVDRKMPEEELLCRKENVNMTQDENLHLDSISSDVLIVPETEPFDFVHYNISEMQVDDVAHNVSIVTDNNDKCKSLSQNVHDSQTAKDTVDCYLDVNSVVSNTVEIKDDKEFNSLSEHQDIMKVKESETFSSTSVNKILCNQLCTETEFDTDSPGTEDFLKLVNCQQMLLKSEYFGSDLKETHISDYDNSSLKFTCSLQCGITESVCNLKLTSFNNNQYLFIQHLTWIQVWRQERNEDWIKIFCHQVDDSFQLKELCVSHDENHLVLVMLLISEHHDHCLQFIVFERESKLIKLMEHAHQFESSCTKEGKTFLCGLDSMRFASALGQATFKVYSHTISCLDDNPRLLTISLGSTADCLHSLCRIDKLPNALLGVSHNMLYVWHLVEARLVTSVRLQVVDPLIIENCIWSTLENGLVFLLVSCGGKEGPEASKLLAANLATGFCQTVLSYTLQPALEKKSLNSKISLVYSEPIIGAFSKDGAFIWSIQEEYCCASLKETNVSSIALAPFLRDSFMIFVGCNGGCVNCYELKLR